MHGRLGEPAKLVMTTSMDGGSVRRRSSGERVQAPKRGQAFA